MSTSADRLRAKIAALRAKTSANGCTEAEALAAAEVAARLMREHGLSEADLEVIEARAREDSRRSTWRTTLLAFIARVTNTSVMILHDARGSELVFIGRDPWPEVAVYLRDVCLRAVRTELRVFKDGPFYRRRRTLRTKRQASADFVDALVIRLGCRLSALFASTMDHEAKVVAAHARDVRFPGGQDVRPPNRQHRFDEARSEGWRAGGRVPLGHGVSSPAPLQIPLLEGFE